VSADADAGKKQTSFPFLSFLFYHRACANNLRRDLMTYAKTTIVIAGSELLVGWWRRNRMSDLQPKVRVFNSQ